MPQIDLPTDWRTRAADLFTHHDAVLKRLACKNPSVDRDDLHDAFVKTILQIAAEPEKFDSSRESTIQTFLLGASQRTLLQILRTHRRRIKREEKKAEAVANDPPAARSVVDTVADAELVLKARAAVAKTDQERNVLRLWELGHTDAEIGEQLGFSGDGAKRVRDRLTQRLRRLGKRLHEEKP
jgi:DNA-directed RNA polymerase specialized sigma24 family protein